MPRRDRSVFRSYTCAMAKHIGCKRRYRPTVGTIPRICGCQCHEGEIELAPKRPSARATSTSDREPLVPESAASSC